MKNQRPRHQFVQELRRRHLVVSASTGTLAAVAVFVLLTALHRELNLTVGLLSAVVAALAVWNLVRALSSVAEGEDLVSSFLDRGERAERELNARRDGD